MINIALYWFTKDASPVQKSVRYWSKDVMTLRKEQKCQRHITFYRKILDKINNQNFPIYKKKFLGIFKTQVRFSANK